MKKIEAILDEIESWYPESLFPPLPPAQIVDGHIVNEEASRDRISAHMARHIVKQIRRMLNEEDDDAV